MGPNTPLLESVPLPPLLVVVAEHDLIRDTNLEYCVTRCVPLARTWSYYGNYLSGGANMAKEKRPPLKRGQVKLRIVRSISNLMGNAAADDSNSSQAPAHLA
uniref:Alpha/beta hydrolase fold-3 domain-containing protein n=1 Tax=Oryza punctata TaxID=4537 RepID=A0A0E0L3K1_ORYPU